MTRFKCHQEYLAAGIELLRLTLLLWWYHKWKHLQKWSWWYLIHISFELLGLAIFVGPSEVRRDAEWCLYYNKVHEKCSSFFFNIFNPSNIIRNLYKTLVCALDVKVWFCRYTFIYLFIYSTRWNRLEQLKTKVIFCRPYPIYDKQ